MFEKERILNPVKKLITSIFPPTAKKSSQIDTTSEMMLDVIIALAPAAVFGCILFGTSAFLVLITAIVVAVGSEFLWNFLLKKENTIKDLSAVVTGLLLAMCLPSKTPLWMVAIGSFVAIIVVKQMFGGLGCNFANPAITARIVLLVSFPAVLTKYVEPIADTVSSATPLMYFADNTVELPSIKNLFFGLHSGSIGETSAFLLLVGGFYLVIRRIINPIIPACFIGSVAILSLIEGNKISLAVFGGGLMLGAIFMATDHTTSPTTILGKVIFGLGCGILTYLIRRFSSLPEGVSYSILIMNILVPYINKLKFKKFFSFIKFKREEKADE